eukprot:2039364-Alexandrium_andersonii.AAC.1
MARKDASSATARSRVWSLAPPALGNSGSSKPGGVTNADTSVAEGRAAGTPSRRMPLACSALSGASSEHQ